MRHKNINNPIINDVQKQYVKYRKSGKNRTVAIQEVRNDFASELQDEDDRLAVLLGLFFALCNKCELLESIATETLNEIKRKMPNDTFHLETYTFLMNEVQDAKDKKMYGEEATYKRTASYRPNWNIGDVFFHTMNFPTAEALGIKGWLIILYKVGEYMDEFGFIHHLMLVSLAPPHQPPTCYNDLLNLGFLPMMRLGQKFEYLAQITIKSRRQEKGYELTPIGCFPRSNTPFPCCYEEENPLTAMPLFGRIKPEDAFPGFEDQVCRLYKRHRKLL